jgi:hypothetical protein
MAEIKYDPTTTSRVLEHFIPVDQSEQLGPYNAFLQNFAARIATSSIVNEEKLEAIQRRMSIGSESPRNLSLEEIMDDLWPYIRDDFTRAKRDAIDGKKPYIDFKNPADNLNLDLVAQTLSSVINTAFMLSTRR